jgi:hypothetical protein
MFNLIVAVISIALIAAMAAASIFYGGEAFSESTAKAQAATLVNNGQQIGGAQVLHKISNSGNLETAIGNLVLEGYLQALPTPPASAVATGVNWELQAAGGLGVITLIEENHAAVCDAVVEQGGSDVSSEFFDLNGLIPATLGTDKQFGCITDTVTTKFAYKLASSDAVPTP